MTEQPKTTTIEVSIATYERLHSAKTNLAKIVHKKRISFDDMFRLFLEVKPIDVLLSEMVLENARSA